MKTQKSMWGWIVILGIAAVGVAGAAQDRPQRSSAEPRGETTGESTDTSVKDNLESDPAEPVSHGTTPASDDTFRPAAENAERPPTLAGETDPSSSITEESVPPQGGTTPSPLTESQPALPRDADDGAQAPIFDGDTSRLSFQALLKDGNGDPLAGPTVNLTFNIRTSVGGLVEGPIVLNNTPIQDGVVDVQIPVSPSSFTGAARELGLSVNGGSEISPRMELTSVPYAFRVDRVENEELTDDVELGTASADGSLTVFNASSGVPVVTIEGSTGTLNADGEVNIVDGIGGQSVAKLLQLGSAAQGGRIETRNAAGQFSSIMGSSTSDGGILQLFQANGTLSVDLDGDATGSNGGSDLTLYQANGTLSVDLDGDATGSNGGSDLTLYQADGGIGVFLDGHNAGGAGRVEARDASGTARIALEGSTGSVDATGDLNLLSAISGGTLRGRWDSFGNGSWIETFDPTGDRTVVIGTSGSGDGGFAQFYNSANGPTLRLDGDSGDDGLIELRDAANNLSISIHSDNNGSAGSILLYKDGAIKTVEIIAAEGSTQGSQIRLFKADGTETIQIDGDFNGHGRIITQVLVITGGADLSEQFDIATPADAETTPGMVVSIDPATPGQLVISRRAYDRRVAGVISGAGGVQTGMLMGQIGTEADGQYPVALTGRVYCWCDASDGPITPGDLLTTSDKPGHAMRVTDYARSQGAIIGKAMTSLETGTGLVLVLVSLQ